MTARPTTRLKQRRPGRARPLRLLHLTDPHLFADPERELYGVRTADSFARVLREASIGTAAPDAILVTGDIGDDLSAAAYLQLRGLLQPMGVPVLCLAGNHDAPDVMAELLGAPGFQFGGDAALGPWHVVLVNSRVEACDHGCVGPQGLASLDARLAELRHGPVLVAIHHTPLPVGSPWLDAVGLQDGHELLELLERHPHVKVVVSGHVHQAFDRQHGALRVLASPSTCAQFEPLTTTCRMDLRPPGYRWLLLRPDGCIETRIQWLQDWNVRASTITTRS